MAAFDATLTDGTPVIAHGRQGMKSRPFTRRFKTLAAYLRWSESDAAQNCTVDFVEAA